jgi:predicted permease
VLVFFANIAVALTWTRLRGADAHTRAAAIVGGAVANQGNLGLPMARLAFGERGLQIAVVIMVVGQILTSSVGVAAGTMAKGEHSHLSALAAPFRYPTIYAAVAGLLVNVTGVKLPVPFADSLDTLAQAAIPCMLLVLGLSFRLPKPGHLVDPIAVSANRLLVGPLVAWPLTAGVGLAGVTASTSIMMAGMPTAVMTTIIALQIGLRGDLTVRAVVVSTLVSAATLTVLITLLR